MNVLVTGSEGFIGSHVVSRLQRRPDIEEIFRVDKMEPRVHGGDLPPLRGEDLYVREASEIPAEIIADVDVLIHLAAQVSVADSMHDPQRYIRENTAQTAEMLERFRMQGDLSKIVVASSMSVYGPGGRQISEADPVEPASVYGLTKYDQERLCLMYADMFDAAGVALRFFNIYGPGQTLDNPYTGVIANFARWLLADEPPTVYEDGQQTRDFVYIDDVADATTLAALDEVPSGAYNVATGEATTIESVARTLADALGKDIEPDITGEKRAGDIRHCTGDPSKLADLGWRAQWSFEDGIEEYARWLTQSK